MILRLEQPADQPAVHAVHANVFARPDQLGPVVEAVLTDALRADGDVVPGLSIVAEIDGEVVGHVVCSRATLGEHASLGLGPLGVRQDHQRAGVGSALMHAVLAAADALGFAEVVLLGSPDYYRRFGFELAVPLGVVAPQPEWAPHFQLRRLTGWTPQRTGRFAYAPAFDQV